METLKNRCTAHNELNKAIIKEVPSIIQQLNKYIGKKIINADNRLTKKTPVELKYIDSGKHPDGFLSVQTWLEFTMYSAWLNVKICLHGGRYEDKTSFCIYCKNSVLVANIKDGVLIETNANFKPENYRTDINETEEQAKINKCKELRKQFNQTRDSILIDVQDFEIR